MSQVTPNEVNSRSGEKDDQQTLLQTPVEKSGLSGGQVHGPLPPGRICMPGQAGRPAGLAGAAGFGRQVPEEKSGLSGGQVQAPVPPGRTWPSGQAGSAAGFDRQLPVEKSGLSGGQVQAPVPPGRI